MLDGSPDTQLITIAEAARRIHKTSQTVRNLCEAGVLRYRRIGDRVIVVEADSLPNAANVKPPGRPFGTKKPPELKLVDKLRRRGKKQLADRLEKAFKDDQTLMVPDLPVSKAPPKVSQRYSGFGLKAKEEDGKV